MTRINLVPPHGLSRLHLIAEYREITRVPGSLYKSLNRKNKPFSLDEIPKSFTLGTGHVKFFYDKMKFLRNRYVEIVREMKLRGFKVSFDKPDVFEAVPTVFFNDWTPDHNELRISMERIKERQ